MERGRKIRKLSAVKDFDYVEIWELLGKSRLRALALLHQWNVPSWWYCFVYHPVGGVENHEKMPHLSATSFDKGAVMLSFNVYIVRKSGMLVT